MKGNKYIFALMSLALCVALCACGSKAPEVPTTQAATTEAPSTETTISELPAETVALEEFTLRTSPAKMVSELVTTIYTEEELQGIRGFLFNYVEDNSSYPSIEEVNQHYPVECIRIFAPGFAKGYRVVYLGETGIVVLGVHEMDGKYEVYRWDYEEIEHSLEEYLAIPTGTDIEEIQAMSPGGDYSRVFMSGATSFEGIDLFTSHPTTDGYMVRIYYTRVPVEGEGWKRLVVDRVYYELI